MKFFYANLRNRVRVHGELSQEFPTAVGVRQGCTLPHFLFNFVFDLILQSSIPPSSGGVELFPGGCPTDIEYADDVALL